LGRSRRDRHLGGGLGGGGLGGRVGRRGGRGGLDRGGGLALTGGELALPLGHRLRLGGGGTLGRVTAATGHEAVGDRIGDDTGQQRDRADGVVVARDLVVDLVGVAVGVEDRDDRQIELARLVDGEVLLLRVDDPHGGGHLRHVADAAEGLLELVLLPAEDEELL